MVHVWSINSGERFQGHHGPLVRIGPGVCILIFKQTGVQCIDFGELGSCP